MMLLKVLYSPTDIPQCAASVVGRVGRPPSLVLHAELGMFLFFIGSTMNVKHLCLLFGATPNVCSQAICQMLKLVPQMLMNNEFAKVVFPDEAKMTQLQK